MNWHKLFNSFLLYNSTDWSIHTIRWYKNRLFPFFEFIGDNQANAPPDYEMQIIRYLVLQRENRYSWSTRNGTYTALMKFFEWLESCGEVTESPFKNGRLKRPRKPRLMPRKLRMEHARQMIAAAEKQAGQIDLGNIRHGFFATAVYAVRDAAIMWLLLNTGIRREELTNIRLLDLDLRQREICIRGKASNERIVYPQDTTVKKLQAWIDIRNRITTDWLAHNPVAKPDNELFISIHFHRAGIYNKMRPQAINDILNAWRSRAGIPSDVSVSPHRWRHLYGSEFAAKSRNPFALQKLMGHANIETTRIYVDLDQDTLRGLSDKYNPDTD